MRLFKYCRYLWLQLIGFFVFGRSVGIHGPFTVVNPRNVKIGINCGINHNSAGKRPLIVDCGANIGLTCVYLALLFPEAKIVGIEPDEMNCDFARKNTNKYDVDIVKSAVGCEQGAGKIVDQSVDSNSFRIERKISVDADSVDVITIQDIIDRYTYETYIPLAIKIDIEGFEEDLFSRNVGWISLFKLVIVELHDWMLPGKANSRNFLTEISKLDRDFLFHNENIFSVQNRP